MLNILRIDSRKGARQRLFSLAAIAHYNYFLQLLGVLKERNVNLLTAPHNNFLGRISDGTKDQRRVVPAHFNFVLSVLVWRSAVRRAFQLPGFPRQSRARLIDNLAVY